MMQRLQIIRTAFTNMLQAAARDPMWALIALLAAPLRLWKPLLQLMVIVFLVLLVIGGGGGYVLGYAGFRSGSIAFMVHEWATVLTVVWVIVRFVTQPLILRFASTGDDTHGSARFATAKEAKSLAGSSSGLLIGRDNTSGKLLRYNGPAHLLTMAPTRTGKGVGTIIPNLLHANRSVICIDPKGENAKIAARARRRFGPVHILDPFGITGSQTAYYNPLEMLNRDGTDIAEDASALSDALVVDDPGVGGEAHWNEEAKALIAGLILMVIMHEPPERRTLATLRHFLTLAPDRFAALLARMQESDGASGLIARAANRHLGKADREAAGVLSAAQRHTHFLDSPRMTAVLSSSDFRFAELRQNNATVFLVLPPDRLATHARWLRLLVTQSLTEIVRASPGAAGTNAVSTLYLLDEFASLGYLAPVERAMGLMAGYGIQLWPILQDIHQLRATYGRGSGTFLSNAGVLQVFGVNDHDSARLVSDLLGHETVIFRTMALALDSQQSGISFSQHHTARSLLNPDEVRQLSPKAQLLFLSGQRPVLAAKLAYYSDPEFAGAFDLA
jgi:type IV secretion system protein VirD4